MANLPARLPFQTISAEKTHVRQAISVFSGCCYRVCEGRSVGSTGIYVREASECKDQQRWLSSVRQAFFASALHSTMALILPLPYSLNSYIVLGVTIKRRSWMRHYADGATDFIANPVDAASPRAEELRRLLDIVAGLAPDDQGRVSEPIVKDELAIVEFLTQRANNTSAQEQALNNSAAIPPYSHVLSARANSHAQRFAQQPKQPGHPNMRNSNGQSISSSIIMESPRQERKEGMDPSEQYLDAPQQAPEDSAWSFIAPDLNTIDVHQPFMNSERGLTEHRMPGPLRGPARSRQNSLLEQAYTESTSFMPRPHPAQPNAMMGDAEHQAGLQGYENQFSSELDLSASNATNLDSWWNDTFGQLPAATGVSGDTGFNPFYLSQLGQGSDTMSENRLVLACALV
jgi:hypothetical protein